MSVVEDKDLPEHMIKISKLAHMIAESYFESLWNLALKELDKKMDNRQISYNDTLSFMSTLIMHFTGRWLMEMYNKISSKDDAGLGPEDLIKEVLNGIITAFNAKVVYEDEKPLPDGIKKLKRE